MTAGDKFAGGIDLEDLFMGKHETNIDKDIKEIRILTYSAISTMTELNKKLDQFEKNYRLDEVIIELWNKSLNKHQISQRLGIPYSTITRHINKLISDGKIQKRWH